MADFLETESEMCLHFWDNFPKFEAKLTRQVSPSEL